MIAIWILGTLAVFVSLFILSETLFCFIARGLDKLGSWRYNRKIDQLKRDLTNSPCELTIENKRVWIKQKE